MARLGLSGWLARIGSARTKPRADVPPQRDAGPSEFQDPSRWFSGVGSATPEQLSGDASPEAAARVRAALDTLPVTMFEFDSNGIYTCAAGAHINVFGITSAQVVGRSVFNFPRFVPGKNMMVRRALAGETVTFNGIWPRGRFSIRLQPRFDAAGRVASVVGIGYELAKPAAADQQMQQLLQALRQSEARFRAMCESAPLGIFVSNEKLELGYVNPALCTLLGRSHDELVGRHWFTAALHADERERLRAIEHSSAARPEGYEGVLRLVRKSGSSVWTALRMAEMREGSEVLGYVGTITDVTRERSARLAIDRAQRDLRRVIESSPEGIAVVRDGCWIFVNSALAEALGYARPDDLVGQNADAIVHPDDRSQALELIGRPRSAWADGSTHEVRYRRANGEYALMELRAAPLTEFDGAPAALITARDVTERRKLQAQLLVSERLLSVGTIAAGVAHEINNPLAAVMSNLEWVAARLSHLDERPGSESSEVAALRAELRSLHKPLAEAREAAGRVRAIVRDLKLFSRTEEELAGPVELTHVLDSAGRMAWNEVRHRARFVREYGHLPAVQGSEARLGQVFLNLIVNAAQAIPEGHADDHEIRLSARVLPSGRVVVEVRDTGSGIPANIIGRIFDPFFTTKAPGFGTGLGLAICHRIVTSMGGQIEVESQCGQGSTFRVTLAAADATTRAAAPEPPQAVPPAEVRGRVLVVDDDPALVNAIGLVLGEDHEVEVFTSARRALARLHAGERYDAIVCDVMMPEMSGADFHSALVRLCPELAVEVIFLTGGAFTLHAREFLDRVSNPRLDKPFESDHLRALVNRQVSRAAKAGGQDARAIAP